MLTYTYMHTSIYMFDASSVQATFDFNSVKFSLELLACNFKYNEDCNVCLEHVIQQQNKIELVELVSN